MRSPLRTPRILAAALALALAAAPTKGADWPTYRHDPQRSGISTEPMKAPLSQEWVFTATYGPSHAWGDPQSKPVESQLELPRMRFDDAFHVAAVGDLVYFGSSSDTKVYALDAKTGQIRWEFFTEGPVRLAPTVWKGKVYVGSDDGKVYCLDAGDGHEVWRFSAAPGADKVLGNGKMISIWPVRTGVLVDDGIAYFGAGVFPAEGLYLYAVNAADGKLLWKNDTYGRGGMGTVSPQGYMVASKERLFLPSSRSMPAAFSRKDGRFLFHRNPSWRRDGLFGGTFTMLAGDLLFNGTEQMLGVKESSGQLVVTEGSRRLVVDKDLAYLLTGSEAMAIDRAAWIVMGGSGPLQVKLRGFQKQINYLKRREKSDPNAKRQMANVQKQIDGLAAKEKRRSDAAKWRTACEYSDSILLTRGMMFAGGQDVVVGFDTASGKKVWSAKVSGKARGLAAAGGRLLVSTDKGSIHCFVPGKGGKGGKVSPQITAEPFPKNKLTRLYADAADAIVKETGIKRGYALVLGGTGRQALELAKRTDLLIYLVDPDAKRVAAARKALTAAGVYGGKVVVMQAPTDKLPFADYFANLIVCEEPFFLGKGMPAAGEILRMLKPCGGVAYVGWRHSAASSVPPRLRHWLADLRKALAGLGETGTKIIGEDDCARIIRGPLKGAGSWTHQYAEPGNTACSDDQLVRGPIGLLWYGEPGPGRMANRHASAASPLAIGGRMFVQGENIIMAYDSYNGLLLWEREIPGAMRLRLKGGSSNLAAGADSLFVSVGDTCLRIDQATGKTLKTYQIPPAKDKKRHGWGYVACVGDLLYGSSGSDCVFAVEIESGRTRWVHEGKSIMVATICIGDGRVFFVDRAVTKEQQEQCLKTIPEKDRRDRRGRAIKPDVRLVVALNAKTGALEWAWPQYVSDCVNISKGGGDLTVMYANDVLLLCGQPWNGHFWREFFAGDFSRRSLIALAGDDGRPLWSGRKGYRSRPLIVGDRIIAEPWAHDLKTGAEKLRVHPVTGAKSKWQMSRPGHHCGNIAAAPNALFFRSGVTAYYDLNGDYGTAHFGAQRPGCWINSIPANGVVMMPEAASGCVCPFSLQCTVVFAPQKTGRWWGMFSAPGPMTPVKRLAVNFGARGDRNDSKGGLWLAYPRPGSTRLVLNFKLGTQMLQGGGFFNRNADFVSVSGTDDPWIYATGCRGLSRCTIPINKKGGTPKKYTVRLHFGGQAGVKPGQRSCNVLVQGKEVLQGLDPAKEAGGKAAAVVKEVKGVEVSGALTIELKPAGGSKDVPVLCGVEILAEK